MQQLYRLVRNDLEVAPSEIIWYDVQAPGSLSRTGTDIIRWLNSKAGIKYLKKRMQVTISDGHGLRRNAPRYRSVGYQVRSVHRAREVQLGSLKQTQTLSYSIRGDLRRASQRIARFLIRPLNRVNLRDHGGRRDAAKFVAKPSPIRHWMMRVTPRVRLR